ncbi:putative acetyltransferase [Rubripirellula amarantea]|uniref:Putative acetyltransferase n=1 Tax=Rubripirellula amarantea TaxID=2527999 RepID=A0A5C5WVT5_9BACT|nr:acyltransferase [Rubripirellula amarantea]TWT54678.1 putative acetyltransferase [Rubripirellula amarantea]
MNNLHATTTRNATPGFFDRDEASLGDCLSREYPLASREQDLPSAARSKIKQVVKSLCRGISVILVSPLLISFGLGSRITSPDASLESHSQLLSLLPGTTGSYLRVAFYRFTLKLCDPSATISFGTMFSKVGAQIHDNVYIGPRCMIGLVVIDKDTLIGPSVQIPSGRHTHGIQRLDTPIRLQPGRQEQIYIGRDCWIGAASIVLANVADQTVVGAGSIVTKPLPPRRIAAGNPAKVLTQRS